MSTVVEAYYKCPNGHRFSSTEHSVGRSLAPDGEWVEWYEPELPEAETKDCPECGSLAALHIRPID